MEQRNYCHSQTKCTIGPKKTASLQAADVRYAALVKKRLKTVFAKQRRRKRTAAQQAGVAPQLTHGVVDLIEIMNMVAEVMEEDNSKKNGIPCRHAIHWNSCLHTRPSRIGKGRGRKLDGVDHVCRMGRTMEPCQRDSARPVFSASARLCCSQAIARAARCRCEGKKIGMQNCVCGSRCNKFQGATGFVEIRHGRGGKGS